MEAARPLLVGIHSYWNKDQCDLKTLLQSVLLFTFFSPELEKSLKKRVKLHMQNGENGPSRENGQNDDIDSDDNYTEVGTARFQH